MWSLLLWPAIILTWMVTLTFGRLVQVVIVLSRVLVLGAVVWQSRRC